MNDLSALAALLLISMNGAPAGEGQREQSRYSQMMIREQIIVRVPNRARKSAPPPPSSQIQWVEERGPRCVPASAIAGASLLGPDSVDLILRNSSRIRAKLEQSCPALDYYYGFYITPHEDGRICANRDTIRSRMGGQCEIERFRTLRPAPSE